MNRKRVQCSLLEGDGGLHMMPFVTGSHRSWLNEGGKGKGKGKGDTIPTGEEMTSNDVC